MHTFNAINHGAVGESALVSNGGHGPHLEGPWGGRSYMFAGLGFGSVTLTS